MNNYNAAILRGVINGIAVAVIFQLYTVMLWVDMLENTFAFYSIGALIAVIAFFAFKNQTAGPFFVSVVISCVLFVATLFIFGLLNIDQTVFKHVHGADAEMWAGDGIGAVFLLIIQFWGGVFGLLAAILYTTCSYLLWKRKMKSMQSNF